MGALVPGITEGRKVFLRPQEEDGSALTVILAVGFQLHNPSFSLSAEAEGLPQARHLEAGIFGPIKQGAAQRTALERG
jgi:hypothetical protein